MLLNTFSTCVELMDQIKCFETVLEVSQLLPPQINPKVFCQLTLSLLDHSSTVDALNAVICTLHRFATIWACMDVVSGIVASLDMAHQIWRAKGIQYRPLLSLLLEFDNGEYLNTVSRDRITADINAFTLVGHIASFFATALKDHRHYNPLLNVQRLFQMSFLKFCFLLEIQIWMLPRYLPIASGSNTGNLLIGHGKSGTILLLASAKYLS